jgi:PAS domain S-box-containing protein
VSSPEFTSAYHQNSPSTIEAFIQEFFSEVSIGIFLTDPAGHTLYMNTSLRRLAGLSATPTAREPWLKTLASEDHDLIDEMWTGAIAEHRKFSGKFRFRRPNGSICWVMAEALPLRTDGQSLTCYVGMVRDITEQQLSIDALRSSEDTYRNIILFSPHAVLIHAKETILFINQACLDLLGEASTDNFRGRRLSECFSDDFLQAIAPPPSCLDKELSLGPVVRRFLRADGVSVNVEIIFHSLRFDGQPAVQVNITDLTAQREIEAQLEQAKKTGALATFASGIAHEFNNCLTAIMGFSDLALPLLTPDSRAHGHIEQVALASKRARDLVSQMLLCGRQGSNIKQPISLDILLKETLRVFRRKLGSNITLREWIPGATKPVLADLTQMHQVFTHLLAHSEQAMGAGGGVLEVRLDNFDLPVPTNGHDLPLPRGQYVHLSFSHAGEAITAGAQPILFDSFSTHRSERRGMDVGCSDVQRIVSEHGGTFRATSTIEQGTTIEIYLPAMSPQDSAISEPPRTEPSNIAERKQFLAERDKER